MIRAISYRNMTSRGDLYFGQFRLRHQEFIDRQHYDVHSFNGMEFDEYDTLASVYLVYTEDDKNVLGVSRLTPTHLGCMLADHWPDLVEDHSLLHDPKVWEGTRFCIDKNLPAGQRRAICHKLACAYVEFGLANEIRKIVGLMPTLILRSVFERSGVSLDRLGPVQEIGAHARIQAAAIDINRDQLRNVNATTGISGVLDLDEAIVGPVGAETEQCAA